MHSISKIRSFLSAHFSPPTALLSPSRPCTILLPVGFNRGEGPRSVQGATTCFRPKRRPCVIPSRSYTAGSSAIDEGSGFVADGRGEIHVIVGPMFSGKTTELLRRVQAESGSGRNVAMIKSSKDDRYGLDYVVTHDGVKMPCWALSELSNFRGKFEPEAYEKLDVIGIDEAQFFGDLYDFCRHAADHDGKSVIVAGLDGDFLRRRFGSVIDIIPLADSVTKLTARCEVCGRRASFTLRKTEQTKIEVIGGTDVYMPVCRQHYVDGQLVIKAARHVLESQKGQCDSCFEVGSSP